MICLLEHFLRSTGQSQILEHCQHSFSRCSALGPSATVWMPQTGSSPALPPPPTCLSHLAPLSERLSGWCNIYPRNPEVQAPNLNVLLPQPLWPSAQCPQELSAPPSLSDRQSGSGSICASSLPALGQGPFSSAPIWSHVIVHFSTIIPLLSSKSYSF